MNSINVIDAPSIQRYRSVIFFGNSSIFGTQPYLNQTTTFFSHFQQRNILATCSLLSSEVLNRNEANLASIKVLTVRCVRVIHAQYVRQFALLSQLFRIKLPDMI